MKANYEEFHALRRRKNKANSNPIKANFVRVNDGFVIPTEAKYVFSRGKTIPKACGFEAATRRQPTEKKDDLKKQSQFQNKQNEHKCLYIRGLWRIWRFLAARKQSQSKPISNGASIH